MIRLQPVTQRVAFAYVRAHHRHHKHPPPGALWWHGVGDVTGLLGVAIVGRPCAKAIDDGTSMEVTRVCTTGARNACSMLYGAARRAALAKGYRRGISYILESESGATLRAAGWRPAGRVRGRSWDCQSRPREDKHPTCDKLRFVWGAWPEFEGQTCE